MYFLSIMLFLDSEQLRRLTFYYNVYLFLYSGKNFSTSRLNPVDICGVAEVYIKKVFLGSYFTIYLFTYFLINDVTM